MTEYTSFQHASGSKQGHPNGSNYPQYDQGLATNGFPSNMTYEDATPFPFPQANGLYQAPSSFGDISSFTAYSGFSPQGAIRSFSGPPSQTISPQAMNINPSVLSRSPMQQQNALTSSAPQAQQQTLDPRMIMQAARNAQQSEAASAGPSATAAALAATPHLAASGAAATPTNDPWSRVQKQLRSELDRERIRRFPNRTAAKVVEMVSMFDKGNDVPATGRAEVLKALQPHPPLPTDFLASFVNESGALDVLENWLKEAVMAHRGKSKEDKTEEAVRSTLTPLLRVLKSLPISLEQIRAGKMGRYVKSVADDKIDFLSTARALAGEVTNTWKSLIKAQQERDKAAAGGSPPDSKKRADAPTEDPARKKPKVDVKPSVSEAKAVVSAKSAVATVASEKPSLSFLSTAAPASAASLSKINITRKKPAVVPKEATPPLVANASAAGASNAVPAAVVAVPSKGGFAEALSLMDKKEPTSLLTDASKRKGVKKRKSVHWKDDSQLVDIREIERAVYEDEGEHMNIDDARKLDISEGQAFKHLDDDEMEASLEWYEPEDIAVPPPEDPSTVVTYPDPQSLTVFVIPEAEVQAERESMILAVSYSEEEGDRPMSAAEPVQQTEEIVAAKEIPLASKYVALPEVQQALHIMASNDYSTPSGDYSDHATSTAQISSLLDQLNPTPSAPAPALTESDANALTALLKVGPAVETAPTDALSLLRNLDVSQLAALTATAGPPPVPHTLPVQVAPASRKGKNSNAVPVNNTRTWGATPTPQPASGNAQNSGWGNGPPESAPTGPAPKRRRTQPFLGKKKSPCKFYALGDCREGDSCTFLHDT